ncbi:MAG: alpha/beta hydrolase [Oceanicaulis sp.]
MRGLFCCVDRAGLRPELRRGLARAGLFVSDCSGRSGSAFPRCATPLDRRAASAAGTAACWAPFAAMAADLGWRVLAPDLPGYGLTRPARHDRGDYDDWLEIIADLADASPGPVALMGLSAGGMTAVFAAERAKCVRGVIATTRLDASDPGLLVRAARWRWLGALSLIGFRLTPWLVDRLSMPIRFAAPMGAMSSDPAMNAYFARDRLLGSLRVRLRLFRTARLSTGWRGPRSSSNCPTARTCLWSSLRSAS